MILYIWAWPKVDHTSVLFQYIFYIYFLLSELFSVLIKLVFFRLKLWSDVLQWIYSKILSSDTSLKVCLISAWRRLLEGTEMRSRISVSISYKHSFNWIQFGVLVLFLSLHLFDHCSQQRKDSIMKNRFSTKYWESRKNWLNQSNCFRSSENMNTYSFHG